jgi:D-alanyl-D-alanine carboxypeptidase (penicillin-binding protein 5/6)
VLVALAAIAAALGHQLSATSSSRAAAPLDVLRSDHRGVLGNVPSTVWPAYGQAAFVRTGQSQIEASPNQHMAAIASVAKVMTAYLVLQDHPLQAGEGGPTITLTYADLADTDRRGGRGESVVPFAAGEQLTERQALQHRRGSGALGRRLGNPVRGPDECRRTVAGHDPHPLHRPERL